MKKIILISALSISFFVSYAQDTEIKTTSNFGIRAGVNSSYLINDGAQLSDTGFLYSLYIGGFKEFELISNLQAGVGLEYFQNGYKSDLIDLKRKLHYLSVPLYLKYSWKSIYVTGGTSLNFKVSEKTFIGGDQLLNPLYGDSKNFDLPLHFGLGVRISRFSIEARHHWGMLEINRGFNNGVVKNRYFQLGATMYF